MTDREEIFETFKGIAEVFIPYLIDLNDHSNHRHAILTNIRKILENILKNDKIGFLLLEKYFIIILKHLESYYDYLKKEQVISNNHEHDTYTYYKVFMDIYNEFMKDNSYYQKIKIKEYLIEIDLNANTLNLLNEYELKSKVIKNSITGYNIDYFSEYYFNICLRQNKANKEYPDALLWLYMFLTNIEVQFKDYQLNHFGIKQNIDELLILINQIKDSERDNLFKIIEESRIK